MKMTKARREYKCHGCGSEISKGDLYRKASKSFGSPEKQTTENREGIPTIVEHGFRTTVQYCERCT